MISKLPDKVKSNIVKGIRDKFNFEAEDDIVDFLQTFQSKVIAEDGFANKKTVRLYNLAVFEFNPKRVDSKSTMNRLLTKYNGDSEKALNEFRELGKTIVIEERRMRKEAKDNEIKKPKKHEPIKGINSTFSAR